MNFLKNSTMKLLGLALFLAIACASVYAQSGRIETSGIDHLASRASETVDINMDERLLQMSARLLSTQDQDEARVRELISGLKGIYVKSFSFDHENEYAETDVEAIRSQLRAPGWTRFLGVHSRHDGENVEVYVMMENNLIVGLAILDFEPKEFTVVNIVGPVDLERLSRIEGQFGVPDFDLVRETTPTRRNE
ncbi:MAG TPA: DUF4252 domain-containing protein [Pyrinomonadaceae bacterium]|nr:DUF4252 domain-containing protein [Pyrinomonadaceae bacterium]